MKLNWYLNPVDKQMILGPPGQGNDDWHDCGVCGSAAVDYMRGPCLYREAINLLTSFDLLWLSWTISIEAPYNGGAFEELTLTKTY